MSVPVETGPNVGVRATAGTKWLAPAVVAAVLSVYAGVVHLQVAPEHFEAWWGYGVFFLGVGIAQLLFAVLVLRRPGTLTSVAGITGNVVVVGLYVLSRTSGVPVGPMDSGHQLERAGVLDLTVTALEVVLIGVLVSLMPARAARPTVNVLLLAGVGLWALRLAGVLA